MTKEKKWYAIYTAPRAEKKVSERFTQLSIDHYLPLQKVKRRWSDRIKEVQVTVIPGYIFVNIFIADFKKVTSVYGAIAFVREGGVPAVIPINQINNLKCMVENSDEPVEFSTEKFEKGTTVTINKGPLKGLVGELIEVQGKHKVIVRLELFGCALTTVPFSFVEAANC